MRIGGKMNQDRPVFILPPSSFRLGLLLHLADRGGVDAAIAEELGRDLAPAAEIFDRELILERRVAISPSR